MKPIIEDQYTAARAYFACVIGLLFFESLLKLPSYLLSLRTQGKLTVDRSPNHSTLRIYIHKLSTIPPLLPFISAHRLPNLFRLAVFIGLNILWGWNRNEFSTDYKLYGWLTIANAGLGLLLATRSNLFSLIARIPSTTLLMYHRWIGRATVIHATIHFALTARRYIKTEQFATVLLNSRIQIGIMAWISLCVIYITSISFIRRRFFELFYYSHFLFIVFAVGALIHASKGPEFMLPGLLLWVVDRAIRFAYNFRKLKVTAVTSYAGDMTKIQIDGVTGARATQVAWVQIPKVSMLDWHPFTIASAPGASTVLAIRGLGGYTKKLQYISTETDARMRPGSKERLSTTSTPPSLKVRMDGPYGMSAIRWGDHALTILVAGGIGITPGISIAAHIVEKMSQASMVGEPADFGAKSHIHLLWIVKERSHIRWFEEELTNLAEGVKRLMPRLTLNVNIHVTGTGEGENGTEMEERHDYVGPGVVVHGRPNVQAWFDALRSERHGMDGVVNVCGPRSLITAARAAASKASWKEGLFHVEEEVFEL